MFKENNNNNNNIIINIEFHGTIKLIIFFIL